MCIGNSISNVEAVRSTLKNQFDRNVVANFQYQEQILDHAFSLLGLGNEGGEETVPHPIIMTEPVCNPIHARWEVRVVTLLFDL